MGKLLWNEELEFWVWKFPEQRSVHFLVSFDTLQLSLWAYYNEKHSFWNSSVVASFPLYCFLVSMWLTKSPFFPSWLMYHYPVAKYLVLDIPLWDVYLQKYWTWSMHDLDSEGNPFPCFVSRKDNGKEKIFLFLWDCLLTAFLHNTSSFLSTLHYFSNSMTTKLPLMLLWPLNKIIKS